MDRYAIPDIDLREALARRGLECHLLMKKPETTNKDYATLLCEELKELTAHAYERELTSEHLEYETWAVTIRMQEEPKSVISCSTLRFVFDLPSYFHTRFEAVHPNNQGVGLGRLLYDCIAMWTRFLVLNDVLALDGVIRSKGDYCLVSCIDKSEDDECEDSENNDEGHGTFLKKLGFVTALHDFGQNIDHEVAFQRAFHIPVQEENPAASGEKVGHPLELKRTESDGISASDSESQEPVMSHAPPF